jgi:hypothetical protein
MTNQVIRLAPQNGILLVLDPESGVLPEAMSDEPVVATPTSLIVETLVEFDGETTVHLTSPDEVPTDGSVKLRWSGNLETTGRVGVVNVLDETLLETPAAPRACVSVWTSRENEPDLIYIAVG